MTAFINAKTNTSEYAFNEHPRFANSHSHHTSAVKAEEKDLTSEKPARVDAMRVRSSEIANTGTEDCPSQRAYENTSIVTHWHPIYVTI